ncbi:TetR/AcrR family transcriptional regulator [Actinoplanes sp. NBC_00393]|uniref:TetR/AcrR family transcriptional regulator n=1 Tax=Actinoplanes sp. NBC_00393 TaxID=2975953 RepID=UPI002E2269F0
MPELSEVRRDHFMRAAIGCFARYGYRRTSMDVIAQAADVSRPALYQYYRNKEDVFRDAVRWGLDDLARRAQIEAGKPGETSERLAAVLSVVVDLHLPRRDGARFDAELIDETRSRAGDHWTAFEQTMVEALLTVLGRPLDDLARVLFYGAKGIAVQLDDRDEALRLLGRLTSFAVHGAPGLR